MPGLLTPLVLHSFRCLWSSAPGVRIERSDVPERCESGAMTGIRIDARRRRLQVQAVMLLVALCVLAPAPASATPAAGAGSGTGPQTASESTANAAPGYPWTWPVEGAHTVTQPFRAPAHEYGPGHRGMDVAAAPDGVVRAPASGVVAFRGDVAGRPLITIDHGDGYVTTLEPVASALPPGAAVAAGDAVGMTAAGGHAVRGTLHVGVRVDGRYVNPRGLFGGLPRAILLPCCAG